MQLHNYFTSNPLIPFIHQAKEKINRENEKPDIMTVKFWLKKSEILY